MAFSANGASSAAPTISLGTPDWSANQLTTGLVNYTWNISNADYFDAVFSGGSDITDYLPTDLQCENYKYNLSWLDPTNLFTYGSVGNVFANYNISAAPYSQTLPATGYLQYSCGVVGETFTATITATQSMTGKSSTASVTVHIPGATIPGNGITSIPDLWKPLIVVNAGGNLYSSSAANTISMGGKTSTTAQVWVANGDWGIYPAVTVDNVSSGLNVSYAAVASPSENINPPGTGTLTASAAVAEIGTLQISLKSGATLPQQIQISGVFEGVTKTTTVIVTQ